MDGEPIDDELDYTIPVDEDEDAPQADEPAPSESS